MKCKKYVDLIKNIEDNEEFLEIMEKLLNSGLPHDVILNFLEMETRSLECFEDDLDLLMASRVEDI